MPGCHFKTTVLGWFFGSVGVVGFVVEFVV